MARRIYDVLPTMLQVLRPAANGDSKAASGRRHPAITSAIISNERLRFS